MSWRPEHEIELVAGTPAGGGQDRPARALIKALESRRLVDVPVRLKNIPGRGGGNGWDYLAQHPGNPHLIGITSPTLITNALLGDASVGSRELTPLANLYTEYIAFVVRADSTLGTGADLLERLKDPATLDIALATAIGNTNHIALALCTQHAGGNVKALKLRVFDSALYAVAEVLEGRAEVGAVTAVSATRELAAGQLRALAVSSPQRMSREWSRVPTWREQGVECVTGTWRGVAGTAGLTADQIACWDAAFGEVAQSDEWNAALERNGWTNTYMDSAATQAFLESERQAIGDALKELGLITAR